MPRNASGVYTLPPTNPVVPFTTIATSWANPTMSDIAQALTDSLDRNGRGGMLAPFKIYDGTVNAPGLGFLNEPNLGIYRSSSGSMDFVSGGATVFKVLNGAALSPTTFLVYGQQEYRAPGYKWWRVKDDAGVLTYTPSATIDASDWDVTKMMSYSPDGLMTFAGTGRRFLADFSSNPIANRLLFQTITPNAATNLGITPNGTQVNARLQIFSSSDPDNANYLNIAQQNTGSTIRAQIAGAGTGGSGAAGPLTLGIGTTDYVTITPGSILVSTDLVVQKLATPDIGAIVMGNSGANIYFDASGFTLNGGNVTVTKADGTLSISNGTLNYKRATPVTHTSQIDGTYSASFTNGLSQILTLGSATAVTIASVPLGGIIRLLFGQTAFGLTFTNVQWPSGVIPNLASGPLKSAIVVVTNTGGYYFGTYSAF